jgi:hypothetical protein
MRKLALLLAVLVVLLCCGGSDAPLPHALAALRTADYDDFIAAKHDNDAEIEKAIQPGSDLCLASGADFVKYGVQYALNRLDQKALFQMPEEERLLYALKIVADGTAELPAGHFLEQAPIRRRLADGEKIPARCESEREQMAAALISNSGYIKETEEGRFRVLKDWIADLKARYGDRLDRRMDAARAHMDAMGYSVQWPVEIH